MSSGTRSLREAAMAAVTARLKAIVPNVTIERSRTADVDFDHGNLPLLVVIGGDMRIAEDTSVLEMECEIECYVNGYVRGATGEVAERAASDLHAAVVSALYGWTPDQATYPGLMGARPQDAEFDLIPTAKASAPCASFTGRFVMQAIGPDGGPWST
jgi:hypothetical protein